MSTTLAQEYIDKNTRIIMSDLGKHTATKMSDTHIVFSKGDSKMGRLDFHLLNGNLVVLGDYGQAIYAFGADVEFESFADFNLSYFASKAVATEVGRLAKDWDSRLAEEEITQHRRDGDIDEGAASTMINSLGTHGTKADLHSTLLQMVNDGDIDGDSARLVDHVGDIVHLRTAIHLEALKKALESLTVTC